ncbi:MAG: hypothetical protein ACLR23_15900 [Clostridia bacterium]
MAFPGGDLCQSGGTGQLSNPLTVEMSMGQMVEDVQLAVNGAKPVRFFRPHRRDGSHCEGNQGRNFVHLQRRRTINGEDIRQT